MTSDPKAPGASAVYLDYSELEDSLNRTEIIDARIKVLTEKGKELATVSIPYEKEVDRVTEVEGRTIHADGTVIPLTAKPSDLMDIKGKGFQLNSIIFTLPSAEVGSILEYRVKFHRDPDWVFMPTWEVQTAYFMHRAHYSFRPGDFTNMMYSLYVGSGAKIIREPGDVFTLDLNDVPPEPDEDWMPPLNAIRWRVEFYNTSFTSAPAYWDSVRKGWAGWVGDFIKPTGQLKQAVAVIVAPGDSDEIKAKKIYDAVMKLENTDFTREKSKVERKKEKLKDIHKAQDVWKQQAGSASAIALLYVALARSAGLKAWPMQVTDRDSAMFDNSYLSSGQLDDFIAVLDLGGETIYLDPGQKMCPFGILHWKHTWATGFRLTDTGAIMATTPGISFQESAVKRVANLYIDKTGNVTGTVRFILDGPEALYWRQLSIENDAAEVNKQFNDAIQADLPEGIQAVFDHFLGLDEYNLNLIAVVNVSGNIGSKTGKYFFLPGLFFESRSHHPFVAESKRTIPIDVHFPEMDIDEVMYHLPPGFIFQSAPQDADTAWPGYALLKIHSSADKDMVTINRTLAYNFTLLDSKDYPSLHDFYLKVASADQQQLVLTRAPAAQGN